ncbi:MAG: PA0069 family radical SAM protein [Flavobacteriales bacterium]|nr:PA0069 family radical SAM protein [Flavobacteriales bacterium]
MDSPLTKKGRGAQHNPHNRYVRHSFHVEAEYLNYCASEGEPTESNATRYLTVYPKTILSKNESPDIPFTYSINPYQGCEHGCSYCYARNTHEYWGYSAGQEFEQVILCKPEAPYLLANAFMKPSWEPQMVMLSGNTDCYQPAERKWKITRELLSVFARYRNPVGIITKNSLILRDLDILRELHAQQLVGITISITTLNEDTRRLMEPRTSSIRNRLKAVEVLASEGIPVNVNLAPIIPGINSHEVHDLVKAAADCGASMVTYIMVRLNGQIGEIFERWVEGAYPERADKVLNGIRSVRQGKLSDNAWGDRMRGHGEMAESVRQMFNTARRKYFQEKHIPPLDTSRFVRTKNGQLGLF